MNHGLWGAPGDAAGSLRAALAQEPGHSELRADSTMISPKEFLSEGLLR